MNRLAGCGPRARTGETFYKYFQINLQKASLEGGGGGQRILHAFVNLIDPTLNIMQALV